MTADALELPVADGAFDGAIVAFGIRNLADLDAGLREVRRVLRPGARFVILEFSTPRNALVRAGYHFYFHYVLPSIGGWSVATRPRTRTCRRGWQTSRWRRSWPHA